MPRITIATKLPGAAKTTTATASMSITDNSCENISRSNIFLPKPTTSVTKLTPTRCTAATYVMSIEVLMFLFSNKQSMSIFALYFLVETRATAICAPIDGYIEKFRSTNRGPLRNSEMLGVTEISIAASSQYCSSSLPALAQSLPGSQRTRIRLGTGRNVGVRLGPANCRLGCPPQGRRKYPA